MHAHGHASGNFRVQLQRDQTTRYEGRKIPFAPRRRAAEAVYLKQQRHSPRIRLLGALYRGLIDVHRSSIIAEGRASPCDQEQGRGRENDTLGTSTLPRLEDPMVSTLRSPSPRLSIPLNQNSTLPHLIYHALR